MPKIFTALVLTAIFMTPNVQAAPTGTHIKGESCWANIGTRTSISSATEFTCAMGKVTLSQIYENGYRVVTMAHNPQSPSFVTIIIEEQK